MASRTLAAAQRREIWNADLYTGTLEQIVATGLAHPDEFPGQAGSRPYARRYFSVDEGEISWHKRQWEKALPGDRSISRDSKNQFRLYVHVNAEAKVIRSFAHRNPDRLRGGSILEHVVGRSPFNDTMRTADASLLSSMLKVAKSDGSESYRDFVSAWVAAAHTEQLVRRLKAGLS